MGGERLGLPVSQGSWGQPTQPTCHPLPAQVPPSTRTPTSSPSLTLNFLPSSSILYSVTVLMFPLMTSLGGGSGAGGEKR